MQGMDCCCVMPVDHNSCVGLPYDEERRWPGVDAAAEAAEVDARGVDDAISSWLRAIVIIICTSADRRLVGVSIGWCGRLRSTNASVWILTKGQVSEINIDNESWKDDNDHVVSQVRIRVEYEKLGNC